MNAILKTGIFALCALPSFASAQNYYVDTRPTHYVSYYEKMCHPYSRHYLVALTYQKDIIELEDGSQWKVNPHDVYRMNYSWNFNDPLMITPNTGLFSSGGGYWITNLRTNNYVRVLPHCGPFVNSAYTHTIAGIDQQMGYLYLENNLSFKLNQNYIQKFNEWIPGETVILGSSNNWFSTDDFIIINVERMNHVEARLY